MYMYFYAYTLIRMMIFMKMNTLGLKHAEDVKIKILV